MRESEREREREREREMMPCVSLPLKSCLDRRDINNR